MIWIIIVILFMILLTVGHSQTKQDIQIQQTEELIQATLPPIERTARNDAKMRGRSKAFMGRLVTWAFVGWLIWFTFLSTPAHAQPYPTYTTEQLCSRSTYTLDYLYRMCVGKNQYGLDILRADWNRVSATTRKRCLDDQLIIERIASQNGTMMYATDNAYWKMADCIYRWGIHEMMPTEVR